MYYDKESSLNKTFLFFVVFLLFAVIATYSNHFYNGFHFDDSHTIQRNTYIKDIHNIPLFFKDASTFSSLPANQSYRPIVSTTLAIDYFLGQGKIFFFHLSTFIIFLLQGVLMFFLFSKILSKSWQQSSNQFIALAAVALYMLHPANAETINYIIARGDSFSTMFIILAFVIYLYWDFGKRYYLYLIPFILACLSKPIGGIFAPLLVLYIYLFESDQHQGITKINYVLIKALPVLITCVLVMLFIKMMDPPTWQAGGVSMFNYVITQPFVLLHYFITFFIPINLSADTDLTSFSSLLDIRFLIGLVFLIILLRTAIIAAKSNRTKPIAFGIFWFFITLLPTSLIPLAEVMNDHRMFLPFVGLTLSVCWGLYLFLDKTKQFFDGKKILVFPLLVAILSVFAAYAYGTWVRNGVWLDEKTLWLDVTQKSPANPRGLMNYGLTLMAEGNYTEAEQYYNRALKLAPNYSVLLTNLGILEQAKNLPFIAENYFKQAIAANPINPVGYYYYGLYLEKQNRRFESIEQFSKVLQLVPADTYARHRLMQIYFEQNEAEKLYQLAEQTLHISRHDDETNWFLQPETFLYLSLVSYNMQHYENSIAAAKIALQLNPNYAFAYNNICAAYNKLGHFAEAVAAGERAVKLDPGNQLAVNNLKWARSMKKIN